VLEIAAESIEAPIVATTFDRGRRSLCVQPYADVQNPRGRAVGVRTERGTMSAWMMGEGSYTLAPWQCLCLWELGS
jgi:hypothetical protein